MSKSELQKWLLDNQGFRRITRDLTLDAVASQFPTLSRSLDTAAEHNWRYLLMCASLLAQSDEGECQAVALRIAQFYLESSDSQPVMKDAAAVVLDILANSPSIDLAVRRNLLEQGIDERLNLSLMQDWLRRSFENSVFDAGLKPIKVNAFQKAFWVTAKVSDWLSISAPTSAGKSYILERWIADFLRSNPVATIAYIVPTRALIQQVNIDLIKLFAVEEIRNVSTTTLPMRNSLKEGMANVLVLTQERYQVMLGETDDILRIELLVVDEAQKIGDGYRGVLLQQAIEATLATNPLCKVIFASPLVENPGLLLEDAPPSASTSAINREDTMVSQNLLWVSQAPRRTDVWNVDLVVNGEPQTLGTLNLPSKPNSDSKRLSFVAHALGNEDGGNIIYVNGAGEAEKIAKQLYDLVGRDVDLSKDDEIRNLVELIQKTVHRRYALASVITRGVAFHYGNMPLTIRDAIERLFSENKIKYLICTSTLIEGVNMPCQSIFIRGPQKGVGKPMEASDFWNLAGRAGRWGKEFQGNVVCVDAKRADVWEKGAPTSRGKFSIQRTVDKVMTDSDSLLSFIRKGSLGDETVRNPDLEHAFSYLASASILHGGIINAPWATRFDEGSIGSLDAQIQEVRATLAVPDDVILKNPGISPIAMDSLLKYFEDRTFNRGVAIETLLPPDASSDDAWKEYIILLNRLNAHFGNRFGRGKRVGQLALLTIDWMRGYTLARIIAGREGRYGSDHLADLIRNTMKDVEEFARYKVPKYLSCYVDLLKVFLREKGRQDLVEELIEVDILMEFGVSLKTQLSLINLGLSRTAALSLSEYITDDNLDEDGCRRWVAENDWMTNDLPLLTKREIRTVFSLREENLEHQSPLPDLEHEID